MRSKRAGRDALDMTRLRRAYLALHAELKPYFLAGTDAGPSRGSGSEDTRGRWDRHGSRGLLPTPAAGRECEGDRDGGWPRSASLGAQEGRW